jgi:peptidoglycan/xylan/chitin deacetylase (PgdA/CDA1 family)
MPRLAPLALACVVALLASPALACGPEALGTARVMQVGVEGGGIGLKSYPRTLALQAKEVVLTFDDGPLPGVTDRILDALKAECVRATFFLIGRNAQANTHLVKREVAEGHTIAHHSFSHPTLRKMADEAARAEIDKGIAADEQAGGVTAAANAPRFFRYPGFADTTALNDWMRTRRLLPMGTDLWASDWAKMTPEAQLKLTMARLDKAGKGIILFHDIKAQTAQMMPAFLKALKAKGYKIVHAVPAAGATAVSEAGPGWTSETDKLIAGLAKDNSGKGGGGMGMMGPSKANTKDGAKALPAKSN